MERMTMRTPKIVFTLIAAMSFVWAAAHAQIVGARSHSQNLPDAVTYLFPEQVTLAAGKPSSIALHFRVAQGLHINSHTPKDDYLIPTNFSIPTGAGVRLDAAAYPTGSEITLAVDPKTKLSVYTGDFIIQAHLVAAAGNHLVQGKLHYQACDRNECMPPKTITVPIDVIGK